VAAPAFPLENAAAPGGPDEADLVNQPADLRFVLSRMLAVNASAGPLGGLVDPSRIAVAGHSDGGDTALAVAYGRGARDRRVGAAIVLAGATLPGTELVSATGTPPLLAVQGTADPVNPSNLTDMFFAALRRPKFRLRLLGAGHFGPYASQQPQLGIVEASTTAFLDLYLKRQSTALGRLVSAGSVRGLANLSAAP
jgi:dienelactone hydrolase